MGPVPRAFAVGRVFFGVATLGSGVLQLATGSAVRLVQSRLEWMPVGVALLVQASAGRRPVRD
jgi:hypothetical protein